MSNSLTIQSCKARTWAAESHGIQKYSAEPYVYHLDAVVSVLREFGISEPSLIEAAYLHDVLEDTPVKYYELRNEFGLRVANIVLGVTDEAGANRRERHAATYPKIAASLDCIIVKLADRIANVRESQKPGNSKRDMYQREYAGFRAALYSVDHVMAQPMWDELDRLHSGGRNV